MKNRTSFSKFMTILSEMFEKTPSKTITEIYWRSLEPFTDQQCEKAFNKIIVSSRFFPKPVDLIDAIQGGEGGNKKDKAVVIANEIIAHLKVHGSRVFPKLDDPVAKHLITHRWPYYTWAANIIENELKWWKKEFCEAYNSYSELDTPLKIAAPEAVKRLINLKAIGG